MDDSLSVDYDRFRYHSRSNSPSDSDRRRPSSPDPSSTSRLAVPLPSPLLGLGKNLGFHRPHRRAKSTDSGDDMAGESSSASNPSLQERVFSKLLQQMLPTDYSVEDYQESRDKRRDKDRPQISLTVMSSNFRRFNARCTTTLTYLLLDSVPDFVIVIDNLFPPQGWCRFHFPAPVISPTRVAETNSYTLRPSNLFFCLPRSAPPRCSPSRFYSALHHGP